MSQPQPAQDTSPQGQAPVINVMVAAPTAQVAYEVADSDKTLRLIAFILNLLTTISVGFLLIPLSWMIPLTVMSYGTYKGTRKNGVGLGVCTLLFINMISGVLLLVSKKEA